MFDDTVDEPLVIHREEDEASAGGRDVGRDGPSRRDLRAPTSSPGRRQGCDDNDSDAYDEDEDEDIRSFLSGTNMYRPRRVTPSTNSDDELNDVNERNRENRTINLGRAERQGIDPWNAPGVPV